MGLLRWIVLSKRKMGDCVCWPAEQKRKRDSMESGRFIESGFLGRFQDGGRFKWALGKEQVCKVAAKAEGGRWELG